MKNENITRIELVTVWLFSIIWFGSVGYFSIAYAKELAAVFGM